LARENARGVCFGRSCLAARGANAREAILPIRFGNRSERFSFWNDGNSQTPWFVINADSWLGCGTFGTRFKVRNANGPARKYLDKNRAGAYYQSMQDETITQQLKAAIDARHNSLAQLRERIADLLRDVPVGTTLSDADGVVCAVKQIATGASQWANRTWEVTIYGRGYLAGGELIAAEIDGEKLDGSNLHYHKTEPYILADRASVYDFPDEPALAWANGLKTRTCALRLAAALARYLAECAEETSANEATLVGASSKAEAC
jgi:hypothetical protein